MSIAGWSDEVERKANLAQWYKRNFEPYEGIAKLLDSFDAHERAMDAMYGGKGARALHEQIQALTARPDIWIADRRLQDLLDNITRPWSGFDSSKLGTLGSNSAILDAQKGIERLVGPGISDSILGEWQRATDLLNSPSLRGLLDQPAFWDREVSAYQMLQDIIERAREDGFEEDELPSRSATRELSLSDWLAIFAIVVSFLQWGRAEYLAAQSDEQAAAHAQQILKAIESVHALAAAHVRIEAARKDGRRWAVSRRVTIIFDEPNGKRIGALAPGQELLEVDSLGKWVEVELEGGDYRPTGWILKKYAERLR